MKKGFIVIECCEEWEQILCLKTGKEMPAEGVLCWDGEGFERHVFVDRKAAKSAIDRTHYYAKAFGRTDMPEKNLCKVVPISLPEI